MPTPTKGPRLGAGPAHQRLLLAGLATQLFEHRSITTTEAKARRLRPFAERLVTFAKKGDLASRRRVLAVVRDKGVVHELFTEIAPAVADRQGGYTRITKIGPRKGDNAPLAVIELVLEPVTPRAATVREAEAATARASRGNRPVAAEPVSEAATPAASAPEDSAVEAPAAEDGGEDGAAAPTDAGTPADSTSGDTTDVAPTAAVSAGAVPAGAAPAAAVPAGDTPAGATSAGAVPAGAPAGVAGTAQDPTVTDASPDTPDAPPAKA